LCFFNIPLNQYCSQLFHTCYNAAKTQNNQTASFEGNKLTINFDKAGQKRVLDSFVERH